MLHEVGHTLGLNHNFKSSHLHNIEESHNTALTKAVGLTGSVMDYVPVNLSLDPKNQGQYYSTVPGTYDDWAIQFGYSSPLENPKDEEKRLNKILALSTDPELMFGNDADDMRYSGQGIDPRVMIGDMTSEPIEHAVQRIKLMDKLMRGLYKKYTDNGVSFHAMRGAFNILTSEKRSCASIVSRFIGGVYVDRFVVGQSETAVPLKPVPRSEQEKAMRTLKEFVFSPEAMFLPDSLVNFLQYQRRGFDFSGKTEDLKIHSLALRTHKVVLNHLLHPKVLQRTIDTQLYGNQYTIEELFEGLTGAVFSADLKGNVNSIRRNLQTEYVNRLINILGQGKNKPSKYDYISQSVSFSNLKTIAKMMSKKSGKNKGTKQHREFLYYKVTSALEQY